MTQLSGIAPNSLIISAIFFDEYLIKLRKFLFDELSPNLSKSLEKLYGPKEFFFDGYLIPSTETPLIFLNLP